MFFVGFPKNIHASKFDAERFERSFDERKNYDELTPLQSRPTARTDFRKGHKSKFAQLVRSTRRNQLIEADRQGFGVARNPSIAEKIDNGSLGSPQQSYSSMTGGRNTSGSSQSIDTISSDSSSSGLRILPKAGLRKHDTSSSQHRVVPGRVRTRVDGARPK